DRRARHRLPRAQSRAGGRVRGALPVRTRGDVDPRPERGGDGSGAAPGRAPERKDQTMSTRSFTGGVTERGVLGRYVHFDGYPERRMPVLRAIVARDGAVAALRTILAAQWGGWSYLDPDRQENSLGEDRAEVVPGYGLRYRDTGPDEPLTLAEVIEDPFI